MVANPPVRFAERRVETERAWILWRRQPKGPDTCMAKLLHRAAPRLHLIFICVRHHTPFWTHVEFLFENRNQSPQVVGISVPKNHERRQQCGGFRNYPAGMASRDFLLSDIDREATPVPD